jgi:DNA-binding MarR family transcriptional regulator
MVQKDLAEQLEITPAAISTAVRHMERCGLIERIPDTHDARLMRLYLSDNAQEMIHESQAQRWRAAASLLEGLPLTEQRMVVEALERALTTRQQAEIEQIT